MYKSNLAFTEDLREAFQNPAANSATIEPTGTFATDPLLRLYARNRRRPTVASFQDSYSTLLRTFRIC